MRPYGWTVNEMLSAFETSIRRACKDETDWRRRHSEIHAEPVEVRRQRAAAARAGRPVPQQGGMSVSDAEAMVARFAASDAMFGAG